jgi:hypothetical protein
MELDQRFEMLMDTATKQAMGLVARRVGLLPSGWVRMLIVRELQGTLGADWKGELARLQGHLDEDPQEVPRVTRWDADNVVGDQGA